MTYTCLLTSTTSVVPRDSWLDNGIAEALTLNLGEGSVEALNMLEWWMAEGMALESRTLYLTSTVLMLLFDFCLMSLNLGQLRYWPEAQHKRVFFRSEQGIRAKEKSNLNVQTYKKGKGKKA